jgi:hypothetical protein
MTCPAIGEPFSVKQFCFSWIPARFTKDKTHVCIFLVRVVHFAVSHGKTLLHFSIRTEVHIASENTYFLPFSYLTNLPASEIITTHSWLEYYQEYRYHTDQEISNWEYLSTKKLQMDVSQNVDPSDHCVFAFLLIYGHKTYPQNHERQYCITRYTYSH